MKVTTYTINEGTASQYYGLKSEAKTMFYTMHRITGKQSAEL